MSAEATAATVAERASRPATPAGRAARLTPHRLAAAGVVGAVLLMAGVASYLAFIHPPYRTDESSHVGYVLLLRDGRLPSLDTKVPTDGGGEELEAALARPWPYSVPEVHVANNPPFPYLAAIPLASLTSALGVTAGPLLGVRLMDVGGAAAAVALSYLLGRELGGRDRYTGVVTSGLVAGIIAIGLVSSVANVDGPALAATTGVTWAVARFCRERSDRAALVLGTWCAIAAAVRPMSLAYAAAAAVLALVVLAARGETRRLVPVGLRLAGPATVFVAWFYVLNIVRYGDPTGSNVLLEDRTNTRSLWDVLTGPGVFVHTMPYNLTEVYGMRPWWGDTSIGEIAIAGGVVLAVIGAVALAVVESRRPTTGGRLRGGGRPLPSAWAVTAVLACVPVVLAAQHMAGGGAGHARYLFPILPILAAAVALLLSRVHRGLGVVVVAALAFAHLARARTAGGLHLPSTMFSEVLHPSLVGHPFRAAALLVAAAGAVVLVASLVGLALRSDPDGRDT